MNENFLKLLNDGAYEEAFEIASQLDLKEVAKILSDVSEDILVPFCRTLDSDYLAQLLVEFEPTIQHIIISSLSEEKLEETMQDVSAEDTADIIEDLPQVSALKIIDQEEVSVLLAEKKFAVLKSLIEGANEIDLAEIASKLTEDELAIFFRLMPKDLAADTFVELDPDAQQTLITKFTDVELKGMMDELFIDDMVDLVEEMPSNLVKRILQASDEQTRAYVNELLKYPADSAGSIMTVEYVYLKPQMTVEKAFAKIRKNAINKETIYTCYVIDEKNKLIGMVTAKDLMLAEKDVLIKDIMEENVIYAYTLDDREKVSRMISDYGFIALPIVDDEKRLVGIVTVDDAIDVLQKENTEDIEKMAGTRASDKPYLKRGVFEIWANRIPWLLVLLVSATFTGLIINTYETKINAISTVLFACVPMLMDTGGNAGSQASVTIIRSLALGEVETKDVLKVIWKEIRVSVLLGVSLGIACFAKLMLLDNLLFGYHDYTPFRCFVVSLSLVSTVVIAKLVGCSLPLLAKKCKLDPAVVASPFITTIVDALSLMIYCSLAIMMLS